MKNKNFLLVIFTLTICLALNAQAKKKSVLPPHPIAPDNNGVILLKDEMQVMKKNYQDIEKSLESANPDYEVMLQSLNRLEGASQLILKINTDPQFAKTFQRFQKDLSRLHRNALEKNRSGVEDGLNDLFQNCFSCHLTHVTVQGKMKEGL
ncbi:MAG: hypothetical protein IPJ69_11380 [Deltaproteobacteria bacterium]|nr:MAG: hypothetical protein IPJ69_11380 [Deltaproteobacteria bacterium]